MADDGPNPDLIRNPWGTPYDQAATAEDCGPGPNSGATLFALLKGLLLKLDELAQKPDTN